ncbi:MAG: hypothetical protein ACLFVS_06560 [Candidatus Acetothermia bacterium]
MRTVREYFISGRFRKRQYSFLFLILLAFLFSFTSSAARLPQKIGRINDYANALKVGDHSHLEERLSELASAGKGLTVLISLNDPYNNPDRFGFEVSRKWELHDNSNEGLMVFVREDDGWEGSFSLPDSIRSLFSGETSYQEFQGKITNMVESGDVRDAVLNSVDTFHSLQFNPGSEDDETRKTSREGNLLYYVFGGALTLALLLFLLIREAKIRCPRCGSRMKVTRTLPDRREKYCPKCGYYERE